MNIAYDLKRVCGSVYSNGNIIFTQDGNTVLSPVGGQLNAFNLVDQTTRSLKFENRKNIRKCVLSPDGQFLITVDVDGHAIFINYPRQVILHYFQFKRKVYDIQFSPNNQYFAVTCGHTIQIWKTPSLIREFSPLILKRTIGGFHDDSTCLDWSTHSNHLIIGSKDLSVKVYHYIRSNRMSLHTLTGHRDRIMGCYFTTSNDTAYTIARDGAVFTWKYREIKEEEIMNTHQYKQYQQRKKKEAENDEENDSDDEDDDESDTGSESSGESDASSDIEEDDSVEEEDDDNNDSYDNPYSSNNTTTKHGRNKSNTVVTTTSKKRHQWVLHAREFLWDQKCDITSIAYQKSHNMLITGFSNGVFGIYEMPGCVNLQRLSISNTMITSATINPTGEWIALGCSTLSQLLIWEWKSESYILKQQGHLYGMNTVAYSTDGLLLATGGEDSKMKLWSTMSGFCVITFQDHIAPVTGVKFIGKGNAKAILSCSLDGTIRAYDLLRYKNFKTLTTADPVQFTCVSSDPSGELICAGTLDPFNIYVWSMQSGHILEVLAGHEGPIACMDFSPTGGQLVSGSWDGTLKIWDIYKNECLDTMEHGCDVLSVAFRPDGQEVCCCCTNGTIYFWDVESATQTNSIEGRYDLAAGRLTTDMRTAASAELTKHFKTVTYSPDGNCILAGGLSKYVCLYSTQTGVLIKKFELSHNKSLEGVNRYLRSDQIVDGVSLENLPIPENDSDFGDSGIKTSSELPGVGEKSGRSNGGQDDGSRTTRKVIMASSISFSQSGREWAVATTQGLQVFGIDELLLFAPDDITLEATPENILHSLNNEKYSMALILSLKLSLAEKELLKLVIESIPLSSIELVIKSVNPGKFKDLFKFLADQIINNTKLELYLTWTWHVLKLYGPYLLKDSKHSLPLYESLRVLNRSLTVHEKELLYYVEQNVYMMNFLITQMRNTKKSRTDVMDEDTDNSSLIEMSIPPTAESTLVYDASQYPHIHNYLNTRGFQYDEFTHSLVVSTSTTTTITTAMNKSPIVYKSRIMKSYQDQEDEDDSGNKSVHVYDITGMNNTSTQDMSTTNIISKHSKQQVEADTNNEKEEEEEGWNAHSPKWSDDDDDDDIDTDQPHDKVEVEEDMTIMEDSLTTTKRGSHLKSLEGGCNSWRILSDGSKVEVIHIKSKVEQMLQQEIQMLKQDKQHILKSY